MKKEKLLLFVLMIIFSLPVLAQQSGVELRGVVVEKGSNNPIEQAAIRLLTEKDSTFIGGAATARNGRFTLKDIKPGNYLLHVSYLGYENLYHKVLVTGRTNPLNVGRLEMSDGAITLGEAVVVAKAAEIVVKNDTIEYNADSYKVTEGSVLEDLLKKMPGVEIDSEGKITVNGKEITKILVDGKEFFSDDPKVASKNLPADMIDKIQTYEKKSDMAKMTGFDDGEEENVINLTVKPGMKQGWFGNAFAGYGSEDRYEGNAMVNRFYNNDQITIMGGINNTNNMGFSDLASTMFSDMGGGGRRMGGGGGGAGNGITTSGNIGINFNKEIKSNLILNGNLRYSHTDNDARSSSRQETILSPDSSTFETQTSKSNAISNNMGANFRLEWKPDTMTTIIFRPDFNYSKSENRSESDIYSEDKYASPIYDIAERYNSKGDGYNLNAQLEFSRKLNNQGRVFSFSVSGGYSERNTEGDNYSSTEYFRRANGDALELIDQEFTYENTGYNYRAYFSVVEPIGNNNFIQATYSFRQNKQESLKYTYLEENGMYNVLDSTYSQSYENNFITQRASLSFRSQREKFNYILGMNVDPSYSSSRTFVGDSTSSRISQNVVNFSPMAQFNYLWDRRTNLRISYNGRTTQPSVNQLQPVSEKINSTNITTGNPDLKPTYTNNFSVRFQKFVPEKQSAFMVMVNANYIMNAIVTKTEYLQDDSGNRRTTYENVNGNYSGNMQVMFNSPFRNKKFSFNTMSMASFSNSNNFVNSEKNTTQNLMLTERMGLDFRSDYLDLGINGNIRYSNINNTLQAQSDQSTFNYGVGGYTTIYLPLNFKIESDINYAANSGYSDGFEQKEVMWNASAAKSFLKNNQGTLRIKFYDILKQQSNISRTITANTIRDTEYNTIGSYFMVHFIYRFSIFSGGGSAADMRGGRGERGPGAGGPPPGGRPPRF